MNDIQITEELGYSEVFSITIATSNGTEQTITDIGICQGYLDTDLKNTDEAWYQFLERLCAYTGKDVDGVPEITTNGYSKG